MFFDRNADRALRTGSLDVIHDVFRVKCRTSMFVVIGQSLYYGLLAGAKKSRGT
jgi:hypothetical protein